MKFFLAQNASFSGVKEENAEAAFFAFVIKVKSNSIQPVDPSLEEADLCTTLRQHLQSAGPSAGLLTCEWTTASSTSISFRVLSSPLTNSLFELFGEDVEMQVSTSNLRTAGHNCSNNNNFTTSEMKFTSGQGYAFEDMETFTGRSPCFEKYFMSDEELKISGNLTVTVSVGTPPGPVVTDKLQIIRKMLQEELGSDLVIIADNGKQVNAHKCMLLTHSDVFSAMLQSDMQEAKTSSVEMPDMSEEGVRALLAYLYCWEEIEPNCKPNVALEMLQAGHKYDIPVLETAMKKLLLAKPTKWYDADVTLNLFFFAKKLPEEDGNCLKMKALRVMKGNFGDFKESSNFITLFKEDPKTAMELSAYFAA